MATIQDKLKAFASTTEQVGGQGSLSQEELKKKNAVADYSMVAFSLAGKDYAISFATDTADDQVWKTVNGGPTLPQTIVLNRRGEVIYNKVGSVTPKVLAALYEEAAVLN